MEAYLPDKKGGGEVDIVSVVQRWGKTGCVLGGGGITVSSGS